jgi:TonB family protein
MQRFVVCFLAALALAPFATHSAAQRSEAALARRWRAPPRDSAGLDALYHATVARGGPRLLAVLEHAAGDRTLAPLSRVHALAALNAYLRPQESERVGEFRWAAWDATRRCERSIQWAEGDTLVVCIRSGSIPEGPWNQTPPSTLATVPRDSAQILEIARRVAAAEPGSAPAGAADLLLWKARAAPSPRVAPCPAERDDAAEAPQARLLNACDVARQISRNYPPLLRDARITGSTTLRLRIGTDGRVRESTVSHSLRPEFDQAALHYVERMRFSPRAAGEYTVEMPILFGPVLEYPRVDASQLATADQR